MVLSAFDFIITTSTSDSECMWVYDCVREVEGQMPNPKRRTTLASRDKRERSTERAARKRKREQKDKQRDR